MLGAFVGGQHLDDLRCVHQRHVASVLFGPVEGPLGEAHQVLAGVRAAEVTQTGRHRHLTHRADRCRGDGLACAVDRLHRLDGGAVREPGDLLAADARQHIAGGGRVRQPTGDLPQHPVAGAVPELLVDTSEAVEVDEGERAGPARASGLVDARAEHLLEGAVVEQPGELVASGGCRGAHRSGGTARLRGGECRAHHLGGAHDDRALARGDRWRSSKATASSPVHASHAALRRRGASMRCRASPPPPISLTNAGEKRGSSVTSPPRERPSVGLESCQTAVRRGGPDPPDEPLAGGRIRFGGDHGAHALAIERMVVAHSARVQRLAQRTDEHGERALDRRFPAPDRRQRLAGGHGPP